MGLWGRCRASLVSYITSKEGIITAISMASTVNGPLVIIIFFKITRYSISTYQMGLLE